MDTKVMSGDAAIELGVELIKSGEVVAFPTETVYGLGGNALSESSIAKIFAAKGRPIDNPLIVHIAELDAIYRLASHVSERNLKVAQAFMPGPITILFPKNDIVPYCVTAGLDTVGIRMPANEIARKFISQCGVPIAAPSANMSTRISPTQASHVYEDLKGRIPLIIDGGGSDVGIESTVVDLSGEVPIILRPGSITASQISQVIGGEVRNHAGEVIAEAPAPGMKYRHYAPRCAMEVCQDIDSVIARYDTCLSDVRAVALIKTGDIAAIGNRNYIDIGSTDEEWLRNIYSSMRDAEKSYDLIICTDLSSTEKGMSAMNRINKAVK